MFWILVFVVSLSWITPPLGDGWARAIEDFFSRLATRRSACIVSLFFLTIALRLLLLPFFPYPRPATHDEFSYLTQADMFAHGRLAFPPHPMSRYFETFHINFHPTYSGIFPPAQATVLALGELFGNPWIGVLTSTAAMVGSFLWMLQGWFTPRWALLGGVIVFIQFAIFSYWMNSYWGGSVAAVGGSLVLGALPRIKRRRWQDGLALGVGMAILANSRPFEGLIFCAPIALYLAFKLYRTRREFPPFSNLRVLLPVAACLAAILGFTLYYNWRVTGNPFTFPHALYNERYLRAPIFVWGKVLPPIQCDNPQFNDLYNNWVLEPYQGTWEAKLGFELKKVLDLWAFFVGPLLSIPLLSFPRLIKDQRMHFVSALAVICVLALLVVNWFIPHYAAPVSSAFVILLVQAMRHLRKWKCKGIPIGITSTRVTIIFMIMLLPINALRFRGGGTCPLCRSDWSRADVVAAIDKLPGQHLVIVRYAVTHDVHHEWVYNSADIDHSKIVWAREIPGLDLSPLLAYYNERKVWIVEPDAVPTRLYPFTRPTKALPADFRP
jgi:hypothetical protein